MRGVVNLSVDLPTRWELPMLPYETRDAIARQVRRREAVYTGLAVEDEEVYRHAHARKLRELAAAIRRAAEKRRTRTTPPGPWPEHTCVYWRTREHVCSMCGAVVP